MASEEKRRNDKDLETLISVVVAVVLASLFYYFEMYGAILASVYLIAAFELLDRTSFGSRFVAFLKRGA